jgi:epoxide hydrolase
MIPRPFEISVPPAALEDLRARLTRTRWPVAWPGVGWEAGGDLDYLRSLCAYWADGFDWPAAERRLNSVPGYLCRVDGVDLHYWRVPGRGPRPLPLLLLHGWPGSIAEFHRLIEPLTDPAAHGGDPADAFELVIPALPGFGFGGKPGEGGWGPTRIAGAFHELMTEVLGHARYGVHGGDWGAFVAAALGARHAESAVGIHLNFALSPRQSGVADLEATEARGRAALDARAKFVRSGSAYGAAQGTVPLALTAAQADSPAGLAAWIVEKFRSWSDCEGDVERAFTRDQLLTNLMFYWAPNSVASSARIYYESRRDAAYLRPPRVEVPTAFASFPKDVMPVVPSWLEPRFDLVRFTEMPRGGHFPALETPDLLVADLRSFFADLR